MEKRGQFTFYRSYFEALMDLQEQERLPILEAIMAYALDGTEPKELSGNGRAVFRLIRPTLDTGRAKAINGALGGSAKGKKSKNKQSLTEGEKEKEVEKEKENEIENEIEIEIEDDSLFAAFWAAYPRQTGRNKAFSVWCGFRSEANRILESLGKWKRCDEWNRENGRFIPSPAKWLRDECWKYVPEDVRIPCGAAGELGERELQAIRRLMEGS